MTGFRLATLDTLAGSRAALNVGDRLHDLATVSGRVEWADTNAVFADWDACAPLLEALAAQVPEGGGIALADARLQAPVLPAAIFCAGANFLDHIRAMERRFGAPSAPHPRDNGGRPFHFLKASQCCVGDGATVATPSPALDYEGELAIIIGRRGRNIAAVHALDYVAGYLIGNDLSARDVAFRAQLPNTNIFHHSWLEHKGFEGSAPLGPMVVPVSQIPDYRLLRLITRVNGEVRQDALCGDMIFSIEEQIEYLSSVLTLMPGTVIMTGTPAGAGMESGRFLSAGDAVSVTIKPIGTLTTTIGPPCSAQPTTAYPVEGHRHHGGRQ